ncbi:hypothetical protein BOTBODRAFT_173431 [Botryobasidium botryosum FD-172 SS1]|uniref:Peptidase M20 dimerisation domain-containing protein n=1 Tax=Botryobasidium botryosum (strain FD-172 SS1) TaxID=930990 RepID=A0A067MK59_BOTB1|nr:hypothetical protein BOTBODRAFT_173431 [Botryobasidium botryosum FD-172 SS1]
MPFASRATAVDLSNLPNTLQTLSNTLFPTLKPIAVNIWNHPEVSTQETFAHDQVINHFTVPPAAGGWNVTAHAFGLPTAWMLTFEHRPAGYTGDLPVVGFMSEYDALPAIGHACGHNLILLNGLHAGSLTRQSLIDYNLPGRVIILGCPDEEQTAGKKRLLDAGAFDGSDVWALAHPTVTNANQPMQSRVDALLKIVGSTHAEAVHKAYQQLVIIDDLAGKLPATQTTATPVEDVGMFSLNVVASENQLGVVGDLNTINSTVAGIKATNAAFVAVNYTIGTDSNGVVLTFSGKGGHVSEAQQSPLSLSVETFRQLTASNPTFTYYLPSNTSIAELDLTVSIRTRYTIDLPTVQNAILPNINTIPSSVTFDLAYPAYEVGPYLADRLIEVMQGPTLNEVWVNSTIAPAATDVGFVQRAVIDPNTHMLLSESKATFHPNFGICPDVTGAGCAFNHEPAFRDLAGTDLAYTQTEKMARALAQIAVELIADPERMAQATAFIKK